MWMRIRVWITSICGLTFTNSRTTTKEPWARVKRVYKLLQYEILEKQVTFILLLIMYYPCSNLSQNKQKIIITLIHHNTIYSVILVAFFHWFLFFMMMTFLVICFRIFGSCHSCHSCCVSHFPSVIGFIVNQIGWTIIAKASS